MKLVRIKEDYRPPRHAGYLFILPDKLPEGYVEAGIYKWAKSVVTGEYHVFADFELEEASDETG